MKVGRHKMEHNGMGVSIHWTVLLDLTAGLKIIFIPCNSPHLPVVLHTALHYANAGFLVHTKRLVKVQLSLEHHHCCDS